jgi:hypothetical protein
MKPSPPQKNISLPTALLAAFTGVAFFLASLSSAPRTQSSSNPVRFAAAPQLIGPVFGGSGATLTKIEIRNAGQSFVAAFQKLKSSQLSEQTRLNGLDCLYTTALEDAQGNLLVEWEPMPAGIVNCFVQVKDYPNRTTWYTVTVDGRAHSGIFRVVVSIPVQ